LALNSPGVVFSDVQDIRRSKQMQREALAVSERSGDRRGMAATLNNLGFD
jgi:hypothetical protein